MILRTFFFLALLVFPVLASSFGLGNIAVDSSLNAPLRAHIPLVAVGPEGSADFRVELASPNAFSRAGLARPFYLSSLRFHVLTQPGGAIVIGVTSRDPIREPYLDFLIKVEWRGQRVVREYTILLDPPIYSPPTFSSKAAPKSKINNSNSGAAKVIAGPTPTPTSYGPVKASETLWVIAKKLRPDSSISVDQMMLALQRKNPLAFSRGNVNLLKRGARLEIPTRNEALLLDKKAARNEFKRQTQVWKQKGKAPKKAGSSGAKQIKAASAKPANEKAKDAQTAVEQGSPGTEESQSIPLKVIETGEEGSVEGVEREGYPVKAPDKLKEAITDAEENLVAVKDINNDIAELKRTLEAKMAALNEALAEKDEAIAASEVHSTKAEYPYLF